MFETFKTTIGDRGAELVGLIQPPSRELQTVAVRPAMLVLPGGAYLFTSDREAEPVALAYAAEGFQTFVLRYSVREKAVGAQPLKEASDAIKYIRDNAEKFHLDPNKVAVCGFSAGGHLAAWVGLCGENKPNAIVLSYGATRMGHPMMAGSPIAQALLGEDANDVEKLATLNLEQFVTPDAPPLFSWSTSDDMLVNVRDVLAMADAYGANKLKFELHVFESGEHGASLAKPITANGRKPMVEPRNAEWHRLSVEWLWRQFGEPEVDDRPSVPWSEHIAAQS